MTLLLTLVTSRGVHQSADYRLTNEGGLVSDQSTKIVQLQYFYWRGAVSYTGVGRVGQFAPRDTSQFLIDWLKGLEEASFEDVAERIRERGSVWLKSIRPPQRHTFVLAGVRDGRPVVSMISNFEDVGGRNDPVPAAELTISTKKSGVFPWLIVAGQKPAIGRTLRKRILASAPPGSDDPQRIRNALQLANEEAASSPTSKGTVSLECSTTSIRVDGSGVSDSSGDVQIFTIMNGHCLDMQALLKEMGLAGHQPVASSFAMSGARVSFPRCPRRTVTPKSVAQFQFQELEIDGFENLHARAINNKGTVVGNCHPVGQPSNQILWIFEQGQKPRELDTACTPFALNDVGQIAVNVPLGQDIQQPAIVEGEQGSMLEIGTWRYAGAHDINEDGTVVGWICMHPSETAQAHHRPAAWIDGKLTILETAPFDWGYASKVNDAGQALVVGYSGHSCVAYRWTPSTGVCEQAAKQGPVPLDLSIDGSILGCARAKLNQAVAVIARPGAEWQRVGGPDGFYGLSINTLGDIGGHIEHQSGGRPALLRADGELAHLPYYRDHYCQVLRVTDVGQAIGSAGTDHGNHALIWTPIGLP